MKAIAMNTAKARGASIVLGLVAAISLGTAMAESNNSPTASRDASIAFANHGAIWDWRANGQNGLWVQASNRKWYYATFMGPCVGLNFANSIGFDTGPMGSLDRWSAVIVPRWGKCTFNSFEASDGPPARHAKANG